MSQKSKGASTRSCCLFLIKILLVSSQTRLRYQHRLRGTSRLSPTWRWPQNLGGPPSFETNGQTQNTINRAGGASFSPMRLFPHIRFFCSSKAIKHSSVLSQEHLTQYSVCIRSGGKCHENSLVWTSVSGVEDAKGRIVPAWHSREDQVRNGEPHSPTAPTQQNCAGEQPGQQGPRTQVSETKKNVDGISLATLFQNVMVNLPKMSGWVGQILIVLSQYCRNTAFLSKSTMDLIFAIQS